MRQVVVSQGQSLVDVCLQELGNLGALLDLADANGLSLSEPLQPGQLLTVPESLLRTPAVVSYYAGRSYRVNVPDPLPAGAADEPPVLPPISRDFLAADTLRTDVY